MRYRLMASFQGAPYQAGIGPSDEEVTLFAACPPPEKLGFRSSSGHWRKRVSVDEIDALWESRPIGRYRNERCMVLDDLGDRMHIAYLGRDLYMARRLGFWEVDRGVFEVVVPRQEITDLREERGEYELAVVDPAGGSVPGSWEGGHRETWASTPREYGHPPDTGPLRSPVAAPGQDLLDTGPSWATDARGPAGPGGRDGNGWEGPDTQAQDPRDTGTWAAIRDLDPRDMPESGVFPRGRGGWRARDTGGWEAPDTGAWDAREVAALAAREAAGRQATREAADRQATPNPRNTGGWSAREVADAAAREAQDARNTGGWSAREIADAAAREARDARTTTGSWSARDVAGPAGPAGPATQDARANGRWSTQANGNWDPQANGRWDAQADGQWDAQADGRWDAQADGQWDPPANGQWATRGNGQWDTQANGQWDNRGNGHGGAQGNGQWDAREAAAGQRAVARWNPEDTEAWNPVSSGEWDSPPGAYPPAGRLPAPQAPMPQTPAPQTSMEQWNPRPAGPAHARPSAELDARGMGEWEPNEVVRPANQQVVRPSTHQRTPDAAVVWHGSPSPEDSGRWGSPVPVADTRGNAPRLAIANGPAAPGPAPSAELGNGYGAPSAAPEPAYYQAPLARETAVNGMNGATPGRGMNGTAPGRHVSRRSSGKPRVTAQAVFSQLLELASIPQSAYAVDAEVDGAMCLVRARGGYEVFSSADRTRHEIRFFEDEEAAYFYLFGILAAEAVRSGHLGPQTAPPGHRSTSAQPGYPSGL
jgi:hypothetical protein